MMCEQHVCTFRLTEVGIISFSFYGWTQATLQPIRLSLRPIVVLRMSSLQPLVLYIIEAYTSGLRVSQDAFIRVQADYLWIMLFPCILNGNGSTTVVL